MKLSVILLLVGCSVASSFASMAKPSSSVNRALALKNRKTSLQLSSTSVTAAEDGSDASPSAPQAGGQATIATSTFNLAKSVIGAGVLSLPSGVAFFADQPSALVPSVALCAIFGLMSAYSFKVIGRLCHETETQSFQDAWAKTVSPKSSWLISTSITSLCFLASLAYSIILGDSFSSLFQAFNLPAAFSQRSNVILLLTSLVLFPLCSLKSLSALAPFSLLGLGGTLYTAVFMLIRFLDGSYKVGGKFFQEIATKPSFNARGGFTLFSPFIFVLISMLSTSFVAHYNAPAFYRELKNPTMPRFNRVVDGAFITSILIFSFIMSIGFLTFGGSSLGFVLNNYAAKDALATLARLSIGVALLTGYPFTFSAMRDGVLDLMQMKGNAREKAKLPVTVGGLGLLTSLALVLKDVGFVVSLSGAMFGCALMFIIPGFMNIGAVKKNAKNMGKSLTSSNKMTIATNVGMMLVGLVMAVIGVAVSVLREMGKM